MSAPSATSVALLLTALALLWWPEPPARSSPVGRRAAAPRWWPTLWPVLAVVGAVVVLVPAWWWSAVPLGAGVFALQRRLLTSPDRRVRSAQRRELALTLEMVAACVSSGMSPAASLSAVLAARAGTERLRDRGVEGPGVRALWQVVALLGVGASPEVAWQPAADCADLGPVAGGATRTAQGGVSLSVVLRDQAATLRRQRARDDAAGASRAGVLMTAPLGLCFLPAFLCLGLAPVVIGLLGSLSLW